MVDCLHRTVSAYLHILQLQLNRDLRIPKKPHYLVNHHLPSLTPTKKMQVTYKTKIRKSMCIQYPEDYLTTFRHNTE